MAKLSAFGKDIGKRLIDLDKPQIWLIGKLTTPKVVQAIREILDLPKQNPDTT